MDIEINRNRPADGSLRWTAWVAIETASFGAEVIHSISGKNMTDETLNETARQECQICGGKLIPYLYGFISAGSANNSPLKDLEYAVGGCDIYPDHPDTSAPSAVRLPAREVRLYSTSDWQRKSRSKTFMNPGIRKTKNKG